MKQINLSKSIEVDLGEEEFDTKEEANEYALDIAMRSIAKVNNTDLEGLQELIKTGNIRIKVTENETH